MSEPRDHNGGPHTQRGFDLQIGMDHAAITTRDLSGAIDFYRDILGLRLRIVETDPIREGRQRAMLCDVSGRDVVELIEMPELPHPAIPGRGAIHHLGFKMPQRAWHSLRARLDAAGYPYEQVDERLFVRDADGLILELEQGVRAITSAAD